MEMVRNDYLPKQPGYQIRRMMTADVHAVYAIECRSHIKPWSKQILRDCVTAGHECYLLFYHDRLIGYVIWQLIVDECHILNLCIDLQSQHQGHGTYLLNHTISQAQTNACYSVYLEVRESNHAAIALYKNNGFTQIGVRKQYYKNKDSAENALIFKLLLT